MLAEHAGTASASRRTEVAVAGLVGLVFGLSPLSSASRPAFSIAGGVGMAALCFGYRRWLLRGAAPPRTAGASWTRDPLTVGVVMLFAACLLPTAVGLFPWYTDSVWQNGQ